MSSSLLSSALSSLTLLPLLLLLQLPSTTLSLQSQLPRHTQLLATNAYIFTYNLFSRTLLDVIPAKIQICCIQLSCHYQPPP
jgi:hypothetical protein